MVDRHYFPSPSPSPTECPAATELIAGVKVLPPPPSSRRSQCTQENQSLTQGFPTISFQDELALHFHQMRRARNVPTFGST